MTSAFHPQLTLGVELSHDTISRIIDGILEEVKVWQSRPLDPIYPILYIDALVVVAWTTHTTATSTTD